MRVLELYCGIGGCAAALPANATVVAAVDIHRGALEIYRQQFPHPVAAREIEAISAAELAAWQADLWWMSPPCQPYTRRGRRRDAADPRARSLLTLLERIREVRPKYVALENVPEFLHSETWQRMQAVFTDCGYTWDAAEICPTELGIPNRRRRAYVLARNAEALTPSRLMTPVGSALRPLREFVDPDCHRDEALRVEPELIQAYRGALHVVDANDDQAVTACFTAAYGRSPVRSGSYLKTHEPAGLRRFAPHEIARLLGFLANERAFGQAPPHRLWPLLGNSLSVHAVRHVLHGLSVPPAAHS